MKNELRQSILEKRNLLSKGEITEKSRAVNGRLINLKQFKDSKIVMFFVSFNSEVNTHEMIKESLKNKAVAVPKVISHEIEPSIILDLDSLIPSGKFEIPEPIELMKIAYKNIDLVLVPGIAFDKSGHRIGYGFGYYDKFLKKVPKAVKVGLCFDLQVVDNISKEEHDVPVDFIVTEERVLECGKK
jgi:5-formyltetrahydrofolate cyclo-ligase